MTDIVLDDKNLYYMARGLRARQAILDKRGSLEDANAEFEKEFWMPYDPNIIISAIEEHPNLNEHLILFLEARFKVKELQKSGKQNEVAHAIVLENKHFEQFEFLRRMTAFDCRSLMFKLND
jgi:hypothetical protein